MKIGNSAGKGSLVPSDTIHLCEHMNPGLTHRCLCMRTVNHPAGKMQLHTGRPKPVEDLTLFDL